jgi:hypothetical protein
LEEGAAVMLKANTSSIGDGLEAALTRKAKLLAEARAIEFRQKTSKQISAWYDARALWPLQGKV